MIGWEIKSSGIYLPEKINSKELDLKYNKKKNEHRRITGVENRYYSYPKQNPSDMAVIAIENALKNSDINLNNIDCIISASATLEQSIPYNAALTLSKLKTKKLIPTFDVNMTCLSFVQALTIAKSYIETGLYKNIIIYSSEISSLSLDRNNTKISGLFGDGAAAFILSEKENKNIQILPKFETHSNGTEYCKIESGGFKHHPMKDNSKYKEKSFFEMDGAKLFKLVGKRLPDFIDELLKQNKLNISDIDMVVPHQASHLGLSHIQKKINIPEHKFLNILKDYGNQVAASIPFGLHYAIENNKIKRGDKIMLIGTSAGVSIGSFIFDY